MKSNVTLGILGVLSFTMAAGCAMGADLAEDGVGKAEQGLSESSAASAAPAAKPGAVMPTVMGTYSTINLRAGTTLFQTLSNIGQNCTVRAYTTAATSATDPVLGIIIQNGSATPTPPTHAWGDAAQPCHHGSPYTQQDGYNTLAFNDDYNPSPDRNARVEWRNASCGGPLSVHVVGSLYGSSPTYGTLRVYYSVSGCSTASQNRSGYWDTNFQANGTYASLGGNVVSAAGAAPAATDPTLYELDSSAPASSSDCGGTHGNAKCDDDCASPASAFSCISGNSGNSLWYFAEGWYGSAGNITVHN